jgi:hypothetical protein
MRRPALAVLAAVALAALAGGCANDPFDPDAVPNSRPVARVFVTAPEGGTLNPTSYYQRTFHWSGSDADGFVTEFYVSIETEEGVAAPWSTTVATDTTLTFSTDDAGEARALIRLACRDNRGALSDTISQFIPLRNFPPVINFVTDYDTTFWSYSSANFRFFALDLDGNVTMDDSLVYYLDTADTTLAPVVEGDPLADPSARPVVKRLDDPAAGLFQVDLHGTIPPGDRRLTVLIGDEADATTRFDWSWEVYDAVSEVLLVDDFAGNIDRPFYHGAMDSIYGAGRWSLYDLSGGLPDRLWVFMETLRQFDCVFWYTGAATSASMNRAADLVAEYLYPVADPTAQPGKLLLIARNLVGGSPQLSPALVQNTFGVNRTATQPSFNIPSTKVCNGIRPGLPTLGFVNGFSSAVGIAAMAGAEPVYQMEYNMFWSPSRRPPYEPFVGVRKPSALVSEHATSVVLTLQFEYVQPAAGLTAVRVLLEDELGVVLP